MEKVVKIYKILKKIGQILPGGHLNQRCNYLSYWPLCRQSIPTKTYLSPLNDSIEVAYYKQSPLTPHTSNLDCKSSSRLDIDGHNIEHERGIVWHLQLIDILEDTQTLLRGDIFLLRPFQHIQGTKQV